MSWTPLLVMWLMQMSGSAVSISSSNISLVVSRHFHGDVFAAAVDMGACSATLCGDLGGVSLPEGGGCRCQCRQPYPTFREDVRKCVSTLEECRLADFSTGNIREKLPFVFMPERGQRVHPSAEITVAEVGEDQEPVVSPVCVVSGSEVITASGWAALNSSFEPPFRLRRDQGRAYLQWVGSGVRPEDVVGRVVLVRLLCKDAGNALRRRFSPCVAFRVAGTQGPDPLTAPRDTSGNSSLAIALSVSAVLGLYLVAMVAYLMHRRRRQRGGDQLIEDALMRKARRSGSFRSRSKSRDRQARRRDGTASDRSCSSPEAVGDSDDGRRGSAGSAGSAEVTERAPESMLSALVASGYTRGSTDRDELSYQDDEPIKKLYFTADFFDPELLHDPPPAALEFVARIREMIDVAKQRLQTRQFQPSLPPIVEAADEAPASSVRAAARSLQEDINQWLEAVTREGHTVRKRSDQESEKTTWGRVAGGSTRTRAHVENVHRLADDGELAENEPRSPWRDASTDEEDAADEVSGSSDFTMEDVSSGSEAAAAVSPPRPSTASAFVTRTSPADEDDTYEDVASPPTASMPTVCSAADDKPPLSLSAASEPCLGTLQRQHEVAVAPRRSAPLRTFREDSLERRGRRGVTLGERGSSPVLDVSLESQDSATYRYWGSSAGSDVSSAYSRINFVSGRSQPAGTELKREPVPAPKTMRTFKDYSTVRFGGSGKDTVKVSLLDQWKKKTEHQARTSSPASVRSVSATPTQMSPEPRSRESSTPTVEIDRLTPTHAGEITPANSPPVPPKLSVTSSVSTNPAATSPVPPPPALSAPDITLDSAAAPPLPPRSSPRQPSVAPPVSTDQPLLAPPVSPNQPPLPPKRVPPPLPSKLRAPVRGSSPVRTIRAERTARVHQQRRDSAGESETNSTASSQSEDSPAGSPPAVGPRLSPSPAAVARPLRSARRPAAAPAASAACDTSAATGRARQRRTGGNVRHLLQKFDGGGLDPVAGLRVQ